MRVLLNKCMGGKARTEEQEADSSHPQKKSRSSAKFPDLNIFSDPTPTD